MFVSQIEEVLYRPYTTGMIREELPQSTIKAVVVSLAGTDYTQLPEEGDLDTGNLGLCLEFPAFGCPQWVVAKVAKRTSHYPWVGVFDHGKREFVVIHTIADYWVPQYPVMGELLSRTPEGVELVLPPV